MSRFLRGVSSFFIVALLVVCVSVPASASTGVVDVAKTFGQWVLDTGTNAGNFFRETIFGSSDPDTAYSDYVSGLPTPNINSAGLSDFYITGWDYTFSSNSAYISQVKSTDISNYGFDVVVGSSPSGTNNRYNALSGPFTIPVTGTYTFNAFVNYPGSQTASLYLWKLVDGSFSLAAWTPYSGGVSRTDFFLYSGYTAKAPLVAGVTYYLSSSPGDTLYPNITSMAQYLSGTASTEQIFSASIYVSGVNYSSVASANYSTDTRTGSLCGDYFYEGDNGTMVQAEKIYLFDEHNNTVNNPATDTTATASSWTYDYATRTYTITATDGSTYTIVSGDDAAAVTIKDSGNISTTYNYYYGTTTGGGSSGGDTESIWTKLGKLFGSITDGFLEVLKAFIGKLLDGLTSLFDLINSKIGNIVNSILSLFDNVPKLFTGFTAFLTAVFPFLPQEFFDILILGAALAAVILIIKMLKR